MPNDYGRIKRLLQILMLIQGEKGWNAKRLAEELQTTQRNIYRDLRVLMGCGVPYFHDRQTNGYCVRHDFFMPAVSLTLDESLALVALAQHIGGKEQIPFTRAASKAISKIRCGLPQAIQAELASLDDHVEIMLMAASSADGLGGVYETIRQAIVKQRVLRCEYDSSSATAPPPAPAASTAPSSAAKKKPPVKGPFLFKPYTLFFCQRAWYAIGYHGGHKEIRSLKLARFTACQLTEFAYEIPKSFTLKKHLGNAWRMIRGKQSYDVELHFDAEFADGIAETHWHDTEEIELQEDGSLIFRCKVDGLDEIVWWVLSMGPHVVVKKPLELATRVKDLAGGIVARYAAKP